MSKKIKAHCNTCGPNKNCTILHSKNQKYEDLEYGDWSYIYYQIVQCDGCESIFMRKEYCDSEIKDERTNKPIIFVKQLPPIMKRKEPEILHSWFYNGHIDLSERPYRNLFREIYIAMSNEALALAAMGIRSLIEGMMIKTVGDNGSFTKNMAQFESQGHISSNQRHSLSAILELGHATMHRNYTPTLDELHLALDVVENIYELIFFGDRIAKRVKTNIPPRK